MIALLREVIASRLDEGVFADLLAEEQRQRSTPARLVRHRLTLGGMMNGARTAGQQPPRSSRPAAPPVGAEAAWSRSAVLNGGNWIPIYSAPAASDEMQITLTARTQDNVFGHQFVKAAFDNFRLNAGSFDPSACGGVFDQSPDWRVIETTVALLFVSLTVPADIEEGRLALLTWLGSWSTSSISVMFATGSSALARASTVLNSPPE